MPAFEVNADLTILNQRKIFAFDMRVNGMSRLNGENLTILNQRKIFALDMRVNGTQ